LANRAFIPRTTNPALSATKIWYVTRLEDNVLYKVRKESDIPNDADSGDYCMPPDGVADPPKKSLGNWISGNM